MAPILLTPKNSLDSQIKAELARLNVKRVLLIGGVNVISTDTEQAVKNMGITVTRLAGSDRYDTSLKIAQAIGATSQAVLTSGDNFPDVLSVAPIAAVKGMPVLLTPNNSISSSLKAYLQNSVQKTYVLGGSSVVSDSVFNQLPSPERISGANRYDNNINIIKKFVSQLDLSTCYLATGESYPTPFRLSPGRPQQISADPGQQLFGRFHPNFHPERRSAIQKIKVFGGTGAVPDSVLGLIVAD
jgi:putative cell wall-binding protein